MTPEHQDGTNGGSKQDMQALQNHNLLIALAHGGSSGGSQHFAMPDIPYALKQYLPSVKSALKSAEAV